LCRHRKRRCERVTGQVPARREPFNGQRQLPGLGPRALQFEGDQRSQISQPELDDRTAVTQFGPQTQLAVGQHPLLPDRFGQH